jgi:hypothetical protein
MPFLANFRIADNPERIYCEVVHFGEMVVVRQSDMNPITGPPTTNGQIAPRCSIGKLGEDSISKDFGFQ